MADGGGLTRAAEHSAAILAAVGMARMPARVLMILIVAEAGGLTADEIGRRLEVSAGAVSGAVRYLQSMGLVRRLSVPGSRKGRYEVPEGAWQNAFAREQPIYRGLAEQAEAALTALGDRDPVTAARLDEMVRFYRFLDARIPEIMAEWEDERVRGASHAARRGDGPGNPPD